MTVSLPTLAGASLPLFDRIGLRRVRFGDWRFATKTTSRKRRVGAVCGNGAFGAEISTFAELGGWGGSFGTRSEPVPVRSRSAPAEVTRYMILPFELRP